MRYLSIVFAGFLLFGPPTYAGQIGDYIRSCGGLGPGKCDEQKLLKMLKNPTTNTGTDPLGDIYRDHNVFMSRYRQAGHICATQFAKQACEYLFAEKNLDRTLSLMIRVNALGSQQTPSANQKQINKFFNDMIFAFQNLEKVLASE